MRVRRCALGTRGCGGVKWTTRYGEFEYGKQPQSLQSFVIVPFGGILLEKKTCFILYRTR